MDIRSKFRTQVMSTGRTLLDVSSRTVGSCGLALGWATWKGGAKAEGGEGIPSG